MKKRFFWMIILIGCSLAATAQIRIGKKQLNTDKLKQAASEVVSAVSLTDAAIADLSRESVEWMDQSNTVSPADSEYTRRLNRITAKFRKIDGLEVNYKVYEVEEVNAFACGDGSIRVYSGLMDVMTDDELAAIIGHEIGHVVNTDVKDAMKNAYLTSAAMQVVGATGDFAAKLTDSQIGEITKAFTSARFSRKQENAADDYAFAFCIKNGFDPYAMANGLSKLVDLSGGTEANALQKMFSSHPDSAERAARMKEKADAHTKNK